MDWAEDNNETLDDPTDVKAAWTAEIRRRAEEIVSGKMVGIPFEEVDRRLREKYPEVRDLDRPA
jgi:putative addiction module component (TIGR02574 family)